MMVALPSTLACEPCIHRGLTMSTTTWRLPFFRTPLTSRTRPAALQSVAIKESPDGLVGLAHHRLGAFDLARSPLARELLQSVRS